MNAELPPVAPDVVAAAVEALTSRLRKKLDAAIESYATVPVTTDGDVRRVRCGEDAEVTLTPGASGAVTEAEQAVCSCLLAPRCLHRTAVLGACPVADAELLAGGDGDADPTAEGTTGGDDGPPADAGSADDTREPTTSATSTSSATPEATTSASTPSAGSTPHPDATTPVTPPTAPTAAQVAAARGLWTAAAAVLAAGVPAAGAVPQAELLRAAHTARLAGLHRAEAAALRVVRGLRGARARHESHRLADLVAALSELLLTSGLLARGETDAALLGTARRAYRPGGALRVHGVCREPVISATGYGGVVTHVLSDDGRWLSVSDVKPGGVGRAKGAGTATVAIGSGSLDHARLARGGLLISGATLSPDGRLGAGKGVRATPVPGLAWTSGPLAALFARPLGEVVAERLADAPDVDPEQRERHVRELVGCDLVVVGTADGRLIAREAPAGRPDEEGVLLRLAPANGHPELPHTANLRQLGARPGLRVRVIGRLESDRAATLRPLAVAPLPDTGATLRLPTEWGGHADLGYDRLEGFHFPSAETLAETVTSAGAKTVTETSADTGTGTSAEASGEASTVTPSGTSSETVPQAAAPLVLPPDPLAEAPLWRLRRSVEVAVSGGRRAAAEPARDGDRSGAGAALRRGGFRTAADLADGLATEADRRSRDVFGRTGEPDPDGYARAWLAAAVYLAGAERSLVRATWLPRAERERPAAVPVS